MRPACHRPCVFTKWGDLAAHRDQWRVLCGAKSSGTELRGDSPCAMGPLPATDRLEAKQLRVCLLSKRVVILRQKSKVKARFHHRSPVIFGCRSSTARHQRPQCHLQSVLSEPSAASREPRLRPPLRSVSTSSGGSPGRASALSAAPEIQKRQPMGLAWPAPKPRLALPPLAQYRDYKRTRRASMQLRTVS